jgi:hypothetical protein
MWLDTGQGDVPVLPTTHMRGRETRLLRLERVITPHVQAEVNTECLQLVGSQ